MRFVRTFFLSEWCFGDPSQDCNVQFRAFDIKAFHDQVLGNGALPLVILEQVIEDWIGEVKSGVA